MIWGIYSKAALQLALYQTNRHHNFFTFSQNLLIFSGLTAPWRMATSMDVDTNVSNVMATAGTTGSVSVSLHPLVIMNISEHWTRVRAQEGKESQGE